MVIDHFQNIFPRAIWDTELTWVAAQRPTPHEFFDYQVLLGYLAPRVGRMRLGVGVTEPIRRHPVLIAQAMMTLSHLTKRAPILGPRIGAGERMNIDPYGLDPSEPVTRLEEALQIIRLCLSAQGPITFSGKHYRLDRATMDLKPASGRVPEIWIAGHGPRMLRVDRTLRRRLVPHHGGARRRSTRPSWRRYEPRPPRRGETQPRSRPHCIASW